MSKWITTTNRVNGFLARDVRHQPAGVEPRPVFFAPCVVGVAVPISAADALRQTVQKRRDRQAASRDQHARQD
jgi:hypothetical protein